MTLQLTAEAKIATIPSTIDAVANRASTATLPLYCEQQQMTTDATATSDNRCSSNT